MTIYNITVNADSDTGRESQKRESARTSTKKKSKKTSSTQQTSWIAAACARLLVKRRRRTRTEKEREKIAFDSLRFVPWFLGFENEREYPQRGNPNTYTRRGRGLERTAIRRTFRSESKRKFVQTERKKRESEKARGSKADRIISYLLLPLPSLFGLEHTNTINSNTIIVGAFDETSRTS